MNDIVNDHFAWIVLLVTFCVAGVFYGIDYLWEKTKLALRWFFNLDDGIGNYDHCGYSQRPAQSYEVKYTPNKPKKCLPHLHRWVFERKERHGWKIIDGVPFGDRNHIENIIKVIKERPGHTETKLATLEEWKRRGFNVAFTSWNHWKCNVCGEKKSTEFYESPIYQSPDQAPPVMDLNDLMRNIERNKQTQQIPTQQQNVSIRREIAVEPVKKYK